MRKWEKSTGNDEATITVKPVHGQSYTKSQTDSTSGLQNGDESYQKNKKYICKNYHVWYWSWLS